METKQIDARGLACPLPVVNAKQAAAAMPEGGVITVLVDNEIAVQNLSKFAEQKGYTAAAEKKAEKEFAVTINVNPTDANAASVNAAETEEAEEDCNIDNKQKGLLVVLSANTMGTGDERLGKNLMKAFVFSLTKQDILPETILCYNTGAFLTTEGSEVLEDLKTMEAEGVTILTCGTCLDFYGLKEKLSVGSVTNMYDIVERMENARKIVKP